MFGCYGRQVHAAIALIFLSISYFCTVLFLLCLENVIFDAEIVVYRCIQHPLSSISLSEFQGNEISKSVIEGENVATKCDKLVEVQLRNVLTSPSKLETEKTFRNRQAKDISDVS
jgi:hypothetical protein